MKLELIDITKRFGSLVANDGVSLTVEEGEIHALLGENGAGKTTLMNVLFGMLRPDSGEIRIGGEPARISSPGDAVSAGIGMVHQHFMLVNVFTVAENVVLGFEPTRGRIFYDRRKASEIRRLSLEYGLEVDPDAVIEDIPVGLRQRVEILKSLERNAHVLILDEPTAVLTPQETEALFRIMRSLAASGRSILFISHKLKEVREIADRVTVMRLGKVVGTTTPAELSEQELASMMVGRSVELTVKKSTSAPGDVVLQLNDLTVADERDLIAVDGIDLQVRAGEIVALAGVQGNGQTELVEAITGLRRAVRGSIVVAGEDLTEATPRQRLHAGVAHVPEDRQKDALVLPMAVADNLVLDMYADPPYAGRASWHLGAVEENAERRVREFDIRARSVEDPVSSLSGGNQQKVVLAREFGRPVKLVVASQPTRGLDVGSIEYVHKRIVAERDQGTAVLIVSSELDEVLALGDRIAVMYRGRIMGVVDPSAGRERIGLMMAGISPDEAPAGDDGVPFSANTGPGGVGLMSSDMGSAGAGQPGVPAPSEPPDKPTAKRTGAERRARAIDLLRWLGEANVLVVTLCAIVAALIVGALLILVTTPAVLQAWGHIFTNPGHAIGESWSTVAAAYSSLVEGSIFNPHAQNLTQAFNPISETLVAATPLMLAGLGVGLGFSTGVFNIGGQGQLIAGAVAALWVGTEIKAPIGIHIPLVIIAGAFGGAVAGFIPGILKATTGAHEVITTIMLNYVFLDLLDWLLTISPFQQPGQSNAISKTMPSTARMPHLFGSTLRLNVSLFVALAMACLIWWLMRRSRLGFSFKVIGLNPDAGKTAGMDAKFITVVVLTISGALIGMAGMATLSGTDFLLSSGYGGNTGFDAITVALLGRNNPGGIVLGSLLFAALISGGRNMQAVTGIPIDLTTVIQAVIVFMVATPALVREVFRLREARGGQARIATKGWTA